MNIYKI